MKTWDTSAVEIHAMNPRQPLVAQPVSGPGYLHLVTTYDLENLRNDLARGEPPPDLADKLARLSVGNLSDRFIEQNCRTMIALWVAANNGAFKQASRLELERLLRVLAYVRKDDDAIPDYRPDGFTDDRLEVR